MTQHAKKSEKNAEKPIKGSNEDKAQAFSVTLGFFGFMTTLTALVGCVVVAFMMGVIVGRDDNDAHLTVAELAEAQEAAVKADRADRAAQEERAELQSTPPPLARGHSEGQSGEQAEGEDASQQGIMSAEELKYATALKGSRGQKVKTSVAPAEKTPAQSAIRDSAESQEANPALATLTVETTQASTATASATVSGTAAQGGKPANALFDYVFQVASLKDEVAVDALRAKLEGEGLRTRMSKSGDYMMVSVLLRGTTAQAQAVQERMVQLKLGQPVLKQKKAVE